jgi:hypothetical protein
MPDPIQFLLAMMEPEVLIEPMKHHPQLTLLVTFSPVHIPVQPLLGARKKLAAALHAGKPDHGKLPALIDPTDMLEAKKREGFRPPTVLRTTLCGKPAKEQQPSLFLGKLQIEFCEAFPELPLKRLCVR